jgi:ParB/RepB/Spo0J family partition protein
VTAGREYRDIRMTEIRPAETGQIRQVFDEEGLQTLAESIRRHGVKEPIIVRPASAGGYEIVAGERRWRAAKLVGLEAMPAIIEEHLSSDTAERLLTQVAENVHRENLNAVEEAAALAAIMRAKGWNAEQAGEEMGKTRRQAFNLQRIHNGPEPVKGLLRARRIELRGAVEFVRIHDALVKQDPKRGVARFEKLLEKAEGWPVKRLSDYAKRLSNGTPSDGGGTDADEAASPGVAPPGGGASAGAQERTAEPAFTTTEDNKLTIDLFAVKFYRFEPGERTELVTLLEGILRHLRAERSAPPAPPR